MFCPKCNKELQDGSLFCSACGYSLKGEEKATDKKNSNVLKWVAIAIISIVVLLVGGLVVSKQVQLNKIVGEFKLLVDDEKYKDALTYYRDNSITSGFTKKANKYIEGKYEKAISDGDTNMEVGLFNSSILTEKYVEDIAETALSKMEELQTSFVSEKVTIDEVKATCDVYAKYKNSDISGKAKTVNDYCQKLDKSRIAYETGVEQADKKKYKVALENLNNVISEDSNYDAAQKKIEEIVPLYKSEVMSSVERDIKAKNYKEAIENLESLAKYCSDSDVSSKLTSVKNEKKAYDEEQEKMKIEKYKNSQEVEVTSTKVWDDGYYLIMMRGQVIIKNNSKKVAKDVSMGMLLFDSNGYPVDVEYSIYQGTYDNEYNCSHSSANIQPGNSYGSGWGLSLPDKCRKIKACVRQVEYTDGTTWTNPYYEYWVKENHSSY